MQYKCLRRDLFKEGQISEEGVRNVEILYMKVVMALPKIRLG